MAQNEVRQRQLELQNRRLLLRIQQLELQAKTHGLVLPPATALDVDGGGTDATNGAAVPPSAWTDLNLVSAPLTPSTPPYIKSEPRDDNSAYRKVRQILFRN
jgi:hypothetical protein